jgi:hypothetical protein
MVALRAAMTRLVLAFCGALFLGGLGAFFLFVPPLLIATAALLISGLMLTLGLGIHLELQPVPPPDSIGRKD